MICSSTGLPHPGEPCAPCAAFEARLAVARADPAYLAATQASEAAWQTYQRGRALPMEEWLKLETAWRAACDEAGIAFSEAYTRTSKGTECSNT